MYAVFETRTATQERDRPMRGLSAIGVNHAIFNMPNVHEIALLEVFGRETILAVAGF
jgi:hypothetical protein